MRFVTPNAPPCKVYQVLALQYPDLRILAEAADEGNDIGYRIAAQHGKFTEAYPKLTLKFVLHVTGDPPGDVELDPEAVARQTKPVHGPLLASLLGLHDRLVLSRRYPLWPLAARKYRRMEAQLSDYPIYMPPHRQHAEYLVQRKARANFDYFIETKSERLEFFGAFLGRFNIRYGFADEEVLNIVKWYERNIYYILPYRRRNYHLFEALEGFKQSWDGPLRGLNVIVDFATFLGECILDRAPQAHWEMAIEDRNFGEHTPVIGGLTRYYPVVSIVNGNAMNRAIEIRFNNYNYRYDILREMPYLNVLRL